MERYKIVNDLPNHCLVLDNNQGRVLYETIPEILLNEQDKKIKELEDKDWYEKTISQLENQVERLLKENEKLKEEQKQIAIEELNKVGYKISQLTYWDNDFEGWIVDLDKLREYLNERVKELKGE